MLPVIADTSDTSEDAAQARTGVAPYSDGVRELAFQVWWLDAARNAELTARRLPGYLPEDHPPELVPDARTIRRWAAKHDWPGEATARMRAVAPLVDDEARSRFDVIYLKGLELWDRILSLDPEVVGTHKGPALNALSHAAIRAAEMGGAGLRHARMVKPGYRPEHQEVDVSQMTEAELTRYTRSLITGEDPDEPGRAGAERSEAGNGGSAAPQRARPRGGWGAAAHPG